MHAEHEHRGIGRAFEDGTCSLQAVHAGQGAIHHHDLGMKLFGQLDGFLAIARLADDLHVRLVFEHAAKSTANQAVIIHEQHCDLLFHKIPLSTRLFPWVRSGEPGFHLPVDAKK